MHSKVHRLFCKQTVTTLIRRRVDLGLHCLPMSHKKDARLIWVNMHRVHLFYVPLQSSLKRHVSNLHVGKCPLKI